MDGRKGRREEAMREERITAMLEEWTFLPTLTMARERVCYRLSKGRKERRSHHNFCSFACPQSHLGSLMTRSIASDSCSASVVS